MRSSHIGNAKLKRFHGIERVHVGLPPFWLADRIADKSGLSYYRYGYFSEAIDAWEAAWKEGRAVTGPRAKVLIDRVVGELLREHAHLGHAERLAALFKDLGDQHVAGPAKKRRGCVRERPRNLQFLPCSKSSPGAARDDRVQRHEFGLRGHGIKVEGVEAGGGSIAVKQEITVGTINSLLLSLERNA